MYKVYSRFFVVLIDDRCQVPVTEAITYGSLRWMAPELVADSSYIPITRATDVWSFGMLSLEIFTDNVPFSHVSNEAFIPLVIRVGSLPTRTEHATTRGLSDAMWNLMNQCWQRDPQSRPSMSEIHGIILNIRPPISNILSGSLHRSSLSSAAGVPGGAPLFGPTLSRPSTGLTPSKALVPLFKPFVPPASSVLSSDLQSVYSLSSQSTSSTSGSSKLRYGLRPFGNKRFQTTPDTSPEISSESLLPGTPSSSGSSLHPGGPPAKLPPPNRTRARPTKNSSRMAAPQPTRSATLSTDLPQSRNWEPVSPVVLGLMEVAASESEGILRPTKDGTVSAGNLEGLVSQVITDIEYPSRNDRFRETFLTIYQLFATSERLFDILKRRFEYSEFDPLTVRSRYPYVNNVLPPNEYC